MLQSRFDPAMAHAWSPGQPFRSLIDSTWYYGTIAGEPSGVWRGVLVTWDGGVSESVCAWDLQPAPPTDTALAAPASPLGPLSVGPDAAQPLPLMSPPAPVRLAQDATQPEQPVHPPSDGVAMDLGGSEQGVAAGNAPVPASPAPNAPVPGGSVQNAAESIETATVVRVAAALETAARLALAQPFLVDVDPELYPYYYASVGPSHPALGAHVVSDFLSDYPDAHCSPITVRVLSAAGGAGIRPPPGAAQCYRVQRPAEVCEALSTAGSTPLSLLA